MDEILIIRGLKMKTKTIFSVIYISEICPLNELRHYSQEEIEKANIDMINRGCYQLSVLEKIINRFESWEEACDHARNRTGDYQITTAPVKLEINIIGKLESEEVKGFIKISGFPNCALIYEQPNFLIVNMKLSEVQFFNCYHITTFKEPISITAMKLKENINLFYEHQVKKIIDDTKEVRLPRDLKNMIFEYIKLPEGIPLSVKNFNSR